MTNPEFPPTISLAVRDPHDVEVLQSAEILMREFRAHGVQVLRDVAQSELRLELSGRSLASGEIELFLREDPVPRKLKIEESVEKTLELARARR